MTPREVKPEPESQPNPDEFFHPAHTAAIASTSATTTTTVRPSTSTTPSSTPPSSPSFSSSDSSCCCTNLKNLWPDVLHLKNLSNLRFKQRKKSPNNTIYTAATQAWVLGTQLWAQLIDGHDDAPSLGNKTAFPACSDVVSACGSELESGSVALPCGLPVGSHVTVVGKPRRAHPENETAIFAAKWTAVTMVSQFMVELRGEKAADGGGRGVDRG